MRRKMSKANWKWWWKQVLAGIIPESVYRFARLKEAKMRLEEKLSQ